MDTLVSHGAAAVISGATSAKLVASDKNRGTSCISFEIYCGYEFYSPTGFT